MKITITFEDKGAQTVEFDIHSTMDSTEIDKNQPTPAAVLALAVKAMFNNGMLARAGQLALEGASKGVRPEEYLTTRYTEKDANDHTNTE